MISHSQTRLDALTEVDDCGQLTIKCSQDYFSLDCGITAYELDDYSPIEDPEGRGPRSLYPELEQDFPELLQSVDLLNIAVSRHNQVSSPSQEPVTTQDPEETINDPANGDNAPDTTMQGVSPQSDSGLSVSKRPLQGFRSDASPTQPLPKKPMYLEGDGEMRRPLQYQADISRSTPSLLDPPDRSKFWLELESVYPSNGSQSYESLHATTGWNFQTGQQVLKRPRDAQIPLERRSSEALRGSHAQMRSSENLKIKTLSEAKQAYSDSSSPPPSSGEDVSDRDSRELSSSPDDRAPTADSLWVTNRNSCVSDSPKERWYGSDEFLALPAQLKKTEMLAMKLESLAQGLPQRCLQEPVQDVDDWELTEVNPEWEGNADLMLHPYRKPFQAGRFSPTSSSDVAPSLDDSIESGPLSDLLSEDEGVRSTPESRGRSATGGRASAPKMILQCTPLIEKLMEDIQHQENYHDVWGKIEVRRRISLSFHVI